MAKVYGVELILDLHGCNIAIFNRGDIEEYFTQLCGIIDMEKCECYFWDDEGLPIGKHQTSPHTKGISAVQFILTSSIVLHSLQLLGSVYINIFSCKDFNTEIAKEFSIDWFEADECADHVIIRTGNK